MINHNYLPLVSFRSPSFTRALRELDDSGLQIEASAVASLNRLFEAENDARIVCQRLTDGIQYDDVDAPIGRLAGTHAERQGLVGTLVKKLGSSPPDLGQCRATLRFGPQYFKGLSNPEKIEQALGEMYAELGVEYRRIQAMELPSNIHKTLSEMSPLGLEE
jgi:hypothetical protein